MTKRTVVLVMILLIAAALRLYKLGQNPPSLDWDEASLGYNAYSLLKTGRDEYGNSWPISIRSFNDYKPPLYTYMTIPSVAIFGLTEFAVRFPSALAGTLTVLVTYVLVVELLGRNKPSTLHPQPSTLALIAAFLLAISPWYLQFSRVAFEANLALFFFVLAAYLFLKGIHSTSSFWLIGSAAAFTATMYTYHSGRIIVPLFLVALAIIFRKPLLERKKTVSIGLILGVLLIAPMILTLMRGSAQARFSTVSVFTNPGIYTQEEERLSRQEVYRKQDKGSLVSVIHNRSLVLSKIIIENYFDHFNFDFLFLRGDGIGRHNAVGMGLVYWWEFPILILGFYSIVKDRWSGAKFLFPWLAVAPLASALTTQTPHAVRSLLMVIPLEIIAAYGIIHLIKALKKHLYILVFICLFAIGNFFYYLDLYYIHTPIERSHDWQYGYKEVVEKVEKYEADVERIVVTNKYDQPHIFFLFYNGVDPSWYQTVAENGSNGFGKYVFRKVEYAKESHFPNTLVIGVPEEIPADAPKIDEVKFLNGKTAFILVKT